MGQVGNAVASTDPIRSDSSGKEWASYGDWGHVYQWYGLARPNNPCGVAIDKLPMTSNSTCTLTTNMRARAVHFGGAFVTGAGYDDDDTDPNFQKRFLIHTYDGHGEEDGVRVAITWQNTYMWHRDPAWMQHVATQCGGPGDIQWNCVDNGGQVEGVYMMGAADNVEGEIRTDKQIQLINTNGFKRGEMVEIQLNNPFGVGVDIEPATAAFNGTIIGGATAGSLLVMFEDNQDSGATIPVSFKETDET